MADLKPLHGDEPAQKERDLAGHLRNTQLGEVLAQGVKKGARAGNNGGYANIGDDYQLKTAYDYLKAWQIFARPGQVSPGDTLKAAATR